MQWFRLKDLDPMNKVFSAVCQEHVPNWSTRKTFRSEYQKMDFAFKLCIHFTVPFKALSPS